MKMRAPFLLLPALAAITLLPSGCETTESGAGTVTVYARTTGADTAPIAGALVSVNTEDGALLASGSTDPTGRLVVEDIPAGSSVSVSAEDSRAGGRVLLTTYDIQPDRSYEFLFEQKSPTDFGTIEIALSNPPAGALYYRIHSGPCGISPGGGAISATLVIRTSCLQSDGKVTVYAEAITPQNEVMGYAIAPDLSLGYQQTLNISFDSWEYPDERLRFTLTNAPGDFDDSGVYGSNVDARIYRKGQPYRLSTNEYGEAHDRVYGGLEYRFGRELRSVLDGQGYQFSMVAGFETPDGISVGGFVTQTPAITGSALYDLTQSLPPLGLRSSIQLSDAARPEFTWTAPAEGVFDAAITLVSWTNAALEPVIWVGRAPADYGLVMFPELPASMQHFAPFADSSFSQAAVMALDASWLEGYESLAESQDILPFLLYQVSDRTEAAGYKFALALSANATFSRPFGETPESAARQPFRLLPFATQ